MPYKKNYRKRYVKKMPSRWENYSNAGSQLIKDVNSLKNLINVEHKRNDQTANTTVDSTGAFYLLNGIAQGDDSTQRTGRSIKLTSFESRMQLYGTSTTVPCSVRVILFCDNQANASLPSVATLLDQTSGLPNIILPKNFDERKRYKIYSDKTYAINPLTEDHSKIFIHKYRKLATHALYNGAGATQTSITSCAFYLYIVSDQTAAAVPAILMQTRVKFIDN